MKNEEGYDCPHPPESRRDGTKTIGGQEVRVEECSICGRVLVHPEDAHKVLSERGPPDGLRMNAEDVLLSILGAYPNRPIYTRLALMKETFLFEKELAREIGISIKNLRFVPYKYGPYSRDVDDAIRNLEQDGLIRIDRVSAGQKEVIKLSDGGVEEAIRLLDGLDEEQLDRIREKRKAWDQLGYRGLLEKIYEEYPSYKTQSEIAEELRPRRRWT